MNQAQTEITKAYNVVLTELKKTYEAFMEDVADTSPNHEDYVGVDVDNAYIWFIESFS